MIKKIIFKIIKVIKKPSLVIYKLSIYIHRVMEHIYVYKDSNYLKRKSKKILFVDLGANLGQGYSWFSRYYNSSNTFFELFEPNPYCFTELQKLPDVKNNKIKVYNVGVGPIAGNFKFYGISQKEGGKFSEGGSIVEDHNSIMYPKHHDPATNVKIINFSEFLKQKSKEFKTIVVKMDIEGAEVDLLEKMINDNSIKLISYLYVEFHSQYQELSRSMITKKRENNIINIIKSMNSTNIRIWH
jgi:FkbM family methyltransferase